MSVNVNISVYVLNTQYECISQTRAVRAIELIKNGKASVVKWSKIILNTVSETIRIPEIIMLLRYVKVFGRVMKCSNRLIWERDDYTCFPPDTLVLMSNGDLRAISTLEVGEKVCDINGDEQTVEAVVSKPYCGDIVKIRRRCIGDFVTPTASHDVFIIANGKGVQTKASLEVSMCDMLFMPKPIFKSRILSFDLCDYVGDRKSIVTDKRYVKIRHGYPNKRFLKCDFDLGKLIGYFLAEGSLNIKNTVNFSFHIDETEYTSDVVSLVKRILGIDAYIENRSHKNTAVVWCHSAAFYDFIRKTFMVGDIKRVACKEYPVPFLEGLLCGIMRGDGTFNDLQKRATLMLANECLCRDIFLISVFLGMLPSLSKTGQRNDGRIHKSVEFNSYDFNRIAEISRVSVDEWKQSAGVYKKKDQVVIDSKLASKVFKKEIEKYDGLVWDIQVSGTSTYVANFSVVHNCQYCGKHITQKSDLQTDHVHPRCRGGKETYENLVTACFACNQKKADRDISECGMKLRRKPFKPTTTRSMARIMDEVKDIMNAMDKLKENAQDDSVPTIQH